LLAAPHAATDDLNRLERIVSLIVLVNGTSEFTEQHLLVENPASMPERPLVRPKSLWDAE